MNKKPFNLRINNKLLNEMKKVCFLRDEKLTHFIESAIAEKIQVEKKLLSEELHQHKEMAGYQ